MTELYEILLPPRDHYSGDYVGSVYLPFGSTQREIAVAANRRFGDDAVAYRRSDTEQWTFLGEGTD